MLQRAAGRARMCSLTTEHVLLQCVRVLRERQGAKLRCCCSLTTEYVLLPCVRVQGAKLRVVPHVRAVRASFSDEPLRSTV